jgi:hypothetical protein
MTKDTGGPAFPQMIGTGKAIWGEDGIATFDKEIVGGMTLRDYAAIHGQGLPDNCTHSYAGHFNADPKPPEGDAIAWAKWWAKAEWAARFINADAMLAERNK